RWTRKARSPGWTCTGRAPTIATLSGSRELSGRCRSVGANGPTDSSEGDWGASQRGACANGTTTLVPLASVSSSPSGGVPGDPVGTAPGPHQFDHHSDTDADFPGASARSEPGGSANTSSGAGERGSSFTCSGVVEA